MIRVLLVEDEDLIRMVARAALEDDGFIVLEAGSGDEAVRMLDGMDHIDIVVTDVRMPGHHDVVDVARHARTRFPLIPVIVVTGFSTNIQGRLMQFIPQVVLVEKPYRLDRLAMLVRTSSACHEGS